MLTVYGRATSSNVQAVMWGLTELGLTADRIDLGHNFGGLDTDDFGTLNPHRKIPVLKDDETMVWESCAILRYLASKYGDGGAFWPADPAARSQVDKWAEWAKADVAQCFTVPIFWSRVRTAAKDRDEAALTRAIDRFEAQMAILDAQLSTRDFVAGNALTLADIVIGHLLFRYYDMDIPRRDLPHLRTYYDRLTARPAYRDHVMISYDMLRAEGA